LQAIYNSSGIQNYRAANWQASEPIAVSPTRTLLVDNQFSPFGEKYAQIGYNGFFAGMLGISASGAISDSYEANYRLYNEKQSRWISPDPAGLSAVDITNPQSWNRYAYVGNDPLNNVDPSGLHWERGAPMTNCFYTAVSFLGNYYQFPSSCTVYYTQVWVPDPATGPSTGQGGGGTNTGGGGTGQPGSQSGGTAAKNGKRPDWLNNITSIFGYDQNIPLKSCFVDVFLQSAANNLNPFQPGLGDIVAGGFGTASALKYNQALKDAATTASRTFGTPNLLYPLKSSTFRGLLQKSQVLGKAAGWAGLDVALGQAFITEMKAMNSGECQ
jgi:RHS repeat-associated protein